MDRLPDELRTHPDLDQANAILHDLNEYDALYINCGATEDQNMTGVHWLRDMFYTPGGNTGPLPVTVSVGESEKRRRTYSQPRFLEGQQ